jgi:hypothetical protein
VISITGAKTETSKEITMTKARTVPTRKVSRMVAVAAVVLAVLTLATPAAAEWSITNFDGGTPEENGEAATQAGAHPFSATTTFSVSTETYPSGVQRSTEELKDAFVDLPPGVLGNPEVVNECSEEQLAGGNFAQCPLDSQVGTINVLTNGVGTTPSKPVNSAHYPVFEMEAPKGAPALFGFNVSGTIVHVYGKLRTGGDYGLTAGAINTPASIPVAGVTFTFWGAPADEHWDPIRGDCMVVQTGLPKENTSGCPASVDLPNKAFFTLQTACTGPQEIVLNTTTWQNSSASASFITHDNAVPPNPVGTVGCEKVPFEPSFSMQPEVTKADAPTGFNFNLTIPQHEAPDEIAASHLKKAVVTLPEGVTINPSGADGLGACTPEQIGLKTPHPARCPESSEIGTVEVDAPLLDHTIQGKVYLASQSSFEESLFATYLAIDDPDTGLIIKLGGKVSPDPVTGQLKAVFDNQPQLPFEELRIRFKGGARAPLVTPTACGTYATRAEFYGWAGNPPSSLESSFTIDRASDGGPCQLTRGFAPRLTAGVLNPIAGSSSPFSLRLLRSDGEAEFASIGLHLPPGLLASVKGLGRCPDATLASISSVPGSGIGEFTNPSCPADALVGSVAVGAGAGTNPFYTRTGRVYLAGPYQGAPLSLAVVVPALAGPFDLGSVVVRNRVGIDSDDAQAHIQSGILPTILSGIVLKVRDLRVEADRAGFIRSPTSCAPQSIAAQVGGSNGAIASLVNRFQMGDCSSLAFRPRLSTRLFGGTQRGDNPRFRAVLTAREGESAISKAAVTLPHSIFLDQSHIRTICTRVQFAQDACPARAIYGFARAFSPLLDGPVQGPVYMRSSNNQLPDLVVALRGPASLPVEIDLVGRVDSVNGGIRTTFESIPDAPVSKFILAMRGGNRSLLVNSRDICKSVNRATVRMNGQNGKLRKFRPLLKADCGKKGRSAR